MESTAQLHAITRFTEAVSLRSMTHDTARPFELLLMTSSGAKALLRCCEIRRLFPGRRLVCSGYWQDEQVFIKLFYAKQSAHDDFQNELRGYRALRQRGIATAQLIHSTALADQPVYVLISENLEPALTFKKAWQQTGDEADQRTSLMARAIELFAQHHNAGVIHRDPHLNNFLLKNDRLYTLDMSDIEVFDTAPDESLCVANLTVFLAIFPAESDCLVADLWRRYGQLRESKLQTSSDYLIQQIRRQRTHSRQRYLKRKILRECSEFIRRRDFGRLLIYRRDADSVQMRQFLNRPDDYIENNARSYLKKGRSSTVAIIPIANQDFVVKRYNVKNLSKALSHSCKRSRALNSWIAAHRLLIHGVATAKPVAVLEKRFGPLRRNAYFLTEYSDGINAQSYFAAPQSSSSEKQDMVDKIAVLLAELYALRISHGDMKATNFLIADGRPYLMDLDSLSRIGNNTRFKRFFRKDLKRFMDNWSNNPELQAQFERKLGTLLESLK